MSDYAAIEKEARIFTEECVTNNRIDPTLFAQYDIKRGLRDKNGKGVLAGITNISRIDAFEERDGQKVPCEGKLWYRGYNVYDLICGLRGDESAAVLITVCMLRDGETVFLDDMTLEEVSRALEKPVIPVGRRGDEVLSAILEANTWQGRW